MADEFLLWLWQGITSDLIQQGVDTNEYIALSTATMV